jgi:hypothetical protein
VKTAVVPDPSERVTTVIAWSGSFTPGFKAAIFASFQLEISPAKINAIVSPSNLQLARFKTC